MAGSFNKVILMGNLTRDAEVRQLQGGNAVAKFAIAVNRKWKGQDGEWKESVDYIDCEAWGRSAENIAKYFSKGSPIFIEGRLKLDQWQDKDGSKRSKLGVVVENWTFVDSKGGGGSSGSREQSYASASSGSDSFSDDDIPF
ncbi:MAG: single-stranded DNA-binding protein [Phycisphaeraceae bacterium]|nr:single-stranded DNA-binding protein [Phycisphaerales bacterium]MCB9861377.1 single-stranded DNA-binding protein [Phycisphaeraceae bacterium]